MTPVCWVNSVMGQSSSSAIPSPWFQAQTRVYLLFPRACSCIHSFWWLFCWLIPPNSSLHSVSVISSVSHSFCLIPEHVSVKKLSIMNVFHAGFCFSCSAKLSSPPLKAGLEKSVQTLLLHRLAVGNLTNFTSQPEFSFSAFLCAFFKASCLVFSLFWRLPCWESECCWSFRQDSIQKNIASIIYPSASHPCVVSGFCFCLQ